MDTVFIKGLELVTTIGVYDWEKRVRQVLYVDLDIGYDNRCPAEEDDLARALNYAAVSERLLAFSAQSSFELIETLAEALAELVLAEFPADSVKLMLHKPYAVVAAQDVGVSIQRYRRDQ